MKHLKSIEKIIKESAKSPEEKEELWKVVEEIVHHRIMGCVLDNLPREHHPEFLEKLSKKTFDAELVQYVSSKSNKNMEKEIEIEVKKLEEEILKEIK